VLRDLGDLLNSPIGQRGVRCRNLLFASLKLLFA